MLFVQVHTAPIGCENGRKPIILIPYELIFARYRRTKLSKKDTHALEKESKQMEERLQELKLAMMREKEDKE